MTRDARVVAVAPWTFEEIRPAKQPRPDEPTEARSRGRVELQHFLKVSDGTRTDA